MPGAQPKLPALPRWDAQQSGEAGFPCCSSIVISNPLSPSRVSPCGPYITRPPPAPHLHGPGAHGHLYRPLLHPGWLHLPWPSWSPGHTHAHSPHFYLGSSPTRSLPVLMGGLCSKATSSAVTPAPPTVSAGSATPCLGPCPHHCHLPPQACRGTAAQDTFPVGAGGWSFHGVSHL